jgi:hypothetical protein
MPLRISSEPRASLRNRSKLAVIQRSFFNVDIEADAVIGWIWGNINLWFHQISVGIIPRKGSVKV